MSSRPSAPAAATKEFFASSNERRFALVRYATVAAVGTSWHSRSSLLATSCGLSNDAPVTLPPGRFYAGNEAKRHGIRTEVEENDWNGGRCTLCRERRTIVGCEDHRHLPADKFSRRFKQPTHSWRLPKVPAVFYGHVLAFDISGFF